MKRVECLDGLRGIAALWVLVGHTMLLTGFTAPLFSQPDLGVDLFILLSGFLMVFQYQIRRDKEDWKNTDTWVGFWLRRLFRIAPLYYILLVIAIVFGPDIYVDRVRIDTFLDRTQQFPERYTDGSIANILMHFSFIFGFLPNYAYRTALPDWSLGLEMQFYAVFPFIVLLVRRTSWLKTSVILVILAILMVAGMRWAHINFPMPSFLPLKMHMFFCGMLIAVDSDSSRRRLAARLLLAITFVAIPIGGATDLTHILFREMMAIAFFGLIHWRSIGMVNKLSAVLGTFPFKWLGELSYGVYLLHLLILHRVAAWAIDSYGADITPAMRFAIVFSIVATVAYSVALITFKLVEKPGQDLGRHVIKRLLGRRTSMSVAPETIAPPL